MAHCVGLAEILRVHGQSYPASHVLPAVQEKAWRAIVACRTPILGGHVECCDHCGEVRHVYHSCRNRHCPQCQTRAKPPWLAARRRDLLPVPYFHLVFTLPHSLNGLAGCDSRTLYALLFGAVANTLNDFAANPRWLSGTPSFTLVLHTWKQYLGRHLHVHALVAGGALTADEFIGRFLLHVLPNGFKRIRHYGLLGPAHKAANLAAAGAAMRLSSPRALFCRWLGVCAHRECARPYGLDGPSMHQFGRGFYMGGAYQALQEWIQRSICLTNPSTWTR